MKKRLADTLLSEAKIALEYIKVNIAAAAELRTSFIMQILGMMLNNITFVVVWWFFLDVFGSINGWTGKDVIGLQGFFAIVFGITFALFSGADDLAKAINNGVFDSVLLMPRNVYGRILTLKTRVSAIGDVFFGLILLGIYAVIAHLGFWQCLLLASFLIPAIIIFTNFLVAASCIGFFIPDSEEVSRFTFEILVGPSLYPSGVYQGIVRVFFIFVLPALALGGLPIEVVTTFSFWKLASVWLMAAVWTFIAFWVLKKGIKRYESGNLTGARI